MLHTCQSYYTSRVERKKAFHRSCGLYSDISVFAEENPSHSVTLRDRVYECLRWNISEDKRCRKYVASEIQLARPELTIIETFHRNCQYDPNDAIDTVSTILNDAIDTVSTILNNSTHLPPRLKVVMDIESPVCIDLLQESWVFWLGQVFRL